MAGLLDFPQGAAFGTGSPAETAGPGGLLSKGNNAAQDRMLGYKIRSDLFPGEQSYFKTNPHVAGMAAETGDVILNPFSPAGTNHNAVAQNEAMRLYMRDNALNPEFAITPQQRDQFAGTSYGSNDPALRQTIAARIYSGDPSANATDEQRLYAEGLKRLALGTWLGAR